MIWIFSYAKLSSHTSWNQVLWWWHVVTLPKWDDWKVMIHGHRVNIIMSGVYTYKIYTALYCKNIIYYVYPKLCFSKIVQTCWTVQMNVLSFLFRTCLENAAINARVWLGKLNFQRNTGCFSGDEFLAKIDISIFSIYFDELQKSTKTIQKIQHSPGDFLSDSIIHNNF